MKKSDNIIILHLNLSINRKNRKVFLHSNQKTEKNLLFKHVQIMRKLFDLNKILFMQNL